MFDFSSGEILLIGAVALIAIGPKELPGMLRTMGQSAAKLRRMAGEFRQQFDDAMKEAELQDVQKTMSETADIARSAVTGFDPISTIRNEIKSTVDEIKGATREAEAAIAAQPAVANPGPVDITPPVTILEPPPEAPVAAVEPAPEAAPAKPKRVRKKPAGDAA